MWDAKQPKAHPGLRWRRRRTADAVPRGGGPTVDVFNTFGARPWANTRSHRKSHQIRPGRVDRWRTHGDGDWCRPVVDHTVYLVAGRMLAFVSCLMGFFGGLVMSSIKRDRGVKDFRATIAGHGGIMDRMDSLSFARYSFHLVRFFFTLVSFHNFSQEDGPAVLTEQTFPHLETAQPRR